MLQFQLVKFGGGGIIQENVVVREVLKMINFSGVPGLSLTRCTSLKASNDGIHGENINKK